MRETSDNRITLQLITIDNAQIFVPFGIAVKLMVFAVHCEQKEVGRKRIGNSEKIDVKCSRDKAFQ